MIKYLEINIKKEMKIISKLLAKFILVSFLSILAITATVHADENSDKFQWFANDYEKILDTADIPTPGETNDRGGILETLVLQGLIYVRYFTVIIGILFLTILGYTLIAEGGSEEQVTKARKGIVFTLIAFLMISMAEDFSEVFRMGRDNQLLTKDGVRSKIAIFDFQVELFMTFVKYILGAYASVMLVRSGLKLVTAGGDEEVVTKHKKGLLYSVAGLSLIFVGDIFINQVFYVTDISGYASTGDTTKEITIDTEEGIAQIAGITSFIVQFVGPISILVLVAGGLMYITSGGDEEKMNKAKRLLIATGIGIMIIYGAFALVSTFLAGDIQAISRQQIDTPLYQED